LLVPWSLIHPGKEADGKSQVWAKDAFQLPILQEFLDATPSAELVPIENGSIQSDEVEM
jgi:hypothetical protein